ncbi:Alpha/Beta hydrolase protein [Hypoxylon sp. NC1633]|nr:Alpha/Beta hydrolase protein [Hypoxylon sp. NC1633]
MMLAPVKNSKLKVWMRQRPAVQDPSIDSFCFTYYKIIGNLSGGAPPVIEVHGGPGAGHEYLLTFADLWKEYRLPVVFYDQIGCASSTHLRQKAGDQSFWQEQLFQDELDNLIDHLDLRRAPGYHLLGQSWGGMLGAAFAARQPQGPCWLVLASALASEELATRGTRLLSDQMPADTQQALDEAEQKQEYEGPAYQRAMDFYRRTYMCRADPLPPELLPAMKHLSEDTTVYSTMYASPFQHRYPLSSHIYFYFISDSFTYGPSTLAMIGSLKKWTVVPRLPKITAPTLVCNSEYDTSHDIAQVPFFELVPRLGRDSMTEIVNNAIAKHRRMECRTLKDDVVCDRMKWFTEQEAREDETWNKVLTRLVSYQVFKQSLPEKQTRPPSRRF